MPATLIGSAPSAACRMIAGVASAAPAQMPAFNAARLPKIMASPLILSVDETHRRKAHAMDATGRCQPAPSPKRFLRNAARISLGMGQWLSHRAHPSIMTRQTWLVDQMFAQLPNIAHTIINPGMFADNFLRVIDLAALLGVFRFYRQTAGRRPCPARTWRGWPSRPCWRPSVTTA